MLHCSPTSLVVEYINRSCIAKALCQNWYIMVLMRFLFLLFVLPFIYCKELRYALFTSGPTGGFDSSGAVPAIELAEELINADRPILPGYNLTHTPVVDTVVSRSV